MDLLHLVDRLEELVAKSQKMPIGNRAIVDRRRLLDIVDQMRIVIPQEVREAEEMVAHRDELRRESEEEARMILARAEERAARLVEEHEISTRARDRAEEIATQSEARLQERIGEANADIKERLTQSRHLAEQQMRAADEYATELLQRLERQIEAFVRSVQSGLAQLNTDPPPAFETDDEEEAPDAPAETAAVVDESAAALGAVVSSLSDHAARQPVPLHGGDATLPDSGPPTETRSNRLENLLRPNPPTSLPAVDPIVLQRSGGSEIIDDFSLPPLDDEPTRAQEDGD